MPKPLTRHERATVARIVRVVSGYYGVFRPMIFAAKSRCEIRIATARQVAMYLAHVVGRIPVNRLRLAFGRDGATIMHNIRKIEDLRDEGSAFDLELMHLENEIAKPGRM